MKNINESRIDELEHKANEFWRLGRLKEEEARQRLHASKLFKEAGEYFKKASEIYDQIQTSKKAGLKKMG